jgi:hypothetical protein
MSKSDFLVSLPSMECEELYMPFLFKSLVVKLIQMELICTGHCDQRKQIASQSVSSSSKDKTTLTILFDHASIGTKSGLLLPLPPDDFISQKMKRASTDFNLINKAAPREN